MYKTEIFNPPHVPDQSMLRDYQAECIAAVEKCNGGSHLIVLPTGAGKTYVFSHLPRHGRVLILSHRDELVHQPEKYYDCPYGVEQAKEHSNGEEVVSASVQSLVRRLDRFDPYDFDMIITDEAHHAVAPSYRKIYNYFKPRIHIGFTATPDRNDRSDLHEVFEDIIFMRDLKWGITMGHLTDIECYQANIGYDLSKVKKQMGDFTVDSLGAEMIKKPCIEAVKDAYDKLHKGPTLTFCVNVEHANLIAAAIPGSAVITADTSNRAEILEDFKNGLIPNICSVGVLTEGTDIPVVGTVLMARPTLNSSLYLQIVGRGLRPYPGKESCRLIDCVGVTKYRPINIGSLFGIGTEMVPKSKQERLNGVKITEMENVVEILLDSPESWINSIQRVNFFQEENDADLKDINFVPMANGSLHLSLGKDKDNVERLVIIDPVDALGQTQAVLYLNKTATKTFAKGDLQTVINDVYQWLIERHLNQRTLWDSRFALQWSEGLASGKQIEFINDLAQTRKRDMSDIDFAKLTKGQAAIIITHLKSEPVVGKRNKKNEGATKGFASKKICHEMSQSIYEDMGSAVGWYKH